ncbi:hypothetical protein BELL_0155g00040 [Botrytis elliptica]|uniref:5'-3' DNA helicase ZGRF1-like N-terminal domain-containing protein n=1 Tax=Botrytis elliptica TaxID=278938 RepID=A0A4Z1JXP3_9HELO|nr:hypothetical protein EAE99_002556 [Botrytis elliptica]TGO76440.1 hypothetical protein BELL_0155g00040 [Botrytis elliptica]
MTASANVAMSMDVPPDQNTAPVLEFRCLYTADTRRKQKRWQDGRLKYHTFNKRVMVFDERSNLVGDAHWREKAPLDEGAELELERNGILVEVSEFMEKKDQDLTELIDKRVKEREERFIARNGDSSPARSAASIIRSQTIAAVHSKPKPLNSILGTPSGHYGKALVSKTSPFEQRQILNAINAGETESPRPTKRRKVNEPPPKNGFAQNLMGATLSFTPTPSSAGPIRYESLKLKTVQRPDVNDIKENVDHDEDILSNGRQGLAGHITRDVISSKSRMQARKRDKPEKSGYASNLTGASLSLSSFREATPRNIERNAVVQKKQPKTIDLSMDTSSDEDGRSISVTKPREVARKKKESLPNISEQTPRLSSSTSAITPVPKQVAKVSSTKLEFQNNASPLNKPQERSHSSLRIKSRPRNKMLMCMDQLGSRSSPSELQGVSGSSKLDSVIRPAIPSSSTQSIQLSLEQETTRSTELKHVLPIVRSSSPRRPAIDNDLGNNLVNDDGNDGPQISQCQDSLRFSDLEEPLSSPGNIGINHQTIDAILCRTRPPEAQKSMPIVAPATREDQEYSVSKQQCQSENIEEGSGQPGLEHLTTLNEKIPQVIEEKTQDREQISQKSPKTLPETSRTTQKQSRNSTGLHEGTASDRASTTENVETRLESNVPPWVTETDTTAISNSTSNPHLPDNDSLIIPNPAKKITSASCALQQNLALPKTTTYPNSDIASKNDSTILASKTVTISPNAAVAPCMQPNVIDSDKILVGMTSNGSTFNATGRFMTKLVPTRKQHQVEKSLIKTSSSLIDETAASSTVAQSSKNVEIKQSPSSIPDIFPVEETRNDETSGFMSANQIAEKESQNRTSEAFTSGDQGPSRPRIMNPATRGMSIQKTAKRTLHALSPPVNQMGPPAAILGGLGSGRNTTNDITGNLGNLGNERDVKGPWSRESFDLFGPWRPPIQQS